MGVMDDPAKVEAMAERPTPNNLKELHGFLALTGYYWHFVKDYGKIVAPLTQLLKKNEFQWSTKADAAVLLLKQAMVAVLILALPDFT